MRLPTLLVSSFAVGAAVASFGLINKAIDSQGTATLGKNGAPALTTTAAPSDTPTSTPTAPANSPPMIAPSPLPTDGSSMPAFTQSVPPQSSRVLATCGKNGAAFIFSRVEEVPIGCHISKTNTPPGSVRLKK